jgi:integrase
MAVTSYEKEVAPGVIKKFYLVIAEGINKYTGKRIQKKRKGITSEVKAERIYRELWNECREQRPDGPLIKKWGELKSSYFSYVENNVRGITNPNGFSPKVVANKKSRFIYLEHWEDLHIELIKAHFVTSEMDKLEVNGLASRSLTACIQKEIRCLLSYAVAKGVLEVNPLSELRSRKVPKKKKQALTHEEVDILLSEAKLQDHPYFFVWLLTLTLGLRRSEMAGLKWHDIDFQSGLLSLRRQRQPKEGVIENLKDNEERTVAIPNYVIPVLKEYRLRSKGDFVIELDCGKWETGQQAQVLRDFCKKIGIKEVTHHQLRATHITLALIDGVPLGIVKENVGHAKLSTTDEYFRSAGIQMRGQTDGLRIKVPTGLVVEVKQLKEAK